MGIRCPELQRATRQSFVRVEFPACVDAVEPSTPLGACRVCHLFGPGDQAVEEAAVLLDGPDPTTRVDLEVLQKGQNVIRDLAAFALAHLAAGPVDELEVRGLRESLQG